jgi:DNA polymerase-4
VPGIGPKTVERLARHGIATLGALGETSDERLGDLFGDRLGPHLRRLARFEDERPIELVRVAKSESRETTFDYDISDLMRLEQILDGLVARLCATLAAQRRGGRTIGIKVRLDDFSTHTRARTLAEPVSSADRVGPVAKELLRRFAPSRPVRLLGVRVAGLHDAAQEGAEEQLTLAL